MKSPRRLLAIMIIAVMALFTGQYVQAQTMPQTGQLKIQGKVVDAASGQAIPNISVRLKGTRKMAKTDQNGQFTLDGLSAGKYTLYVQDNKYQTFTQTITLTKSQTNETIKLQPKSNSSH